MKHPIFIVGAPRSGTTLTARILGNHSELFMPGETHFFEDVYARRKELGEQFNPATIDNILNRLSKMYGRSNEPDDQKRIDTLFSSEDHVKTLTSSWNNYKGVLVSFMEMQMRHEGKKRWGNNVPRDIFNYKDILKFFPNAKIIVCIRDPRDFLLSYKNKWRITTPDNVDRLRNLYHPITTSLLWKSSIKLLPVLKRAVPPMNLFTLYYEELVSNPYNTVNRICNFIDERFEPVMQNVDSANSSHNVKQKGIFSSSIGRWEEQLSHEEVYLCQKILKNEMICHGYRLENVKLNYFKLSKTAFAFPFSLARGIYSRRGLRGPLLPYLIRRTRTFVLNVK